MWTAWLFYFQSNSSISISISSSFFDFFCFYFLFYPPFSTDFNHEISATYISPRFWALITKFTPIIFSTRHLKQLTRHHPRMPHHMLVYLGQHIYQQGFRGAHRKRRSLWQGCWYVGWGIRGWWRVCYFIWRVEKMIGAIFARLLFWSKTACLYIWWAIWCTVDIMMVIDLIQF